MRWFPRVRSSLFVVAATLCLGLPAREPLLQREVINSAGFLAAHPDLRWRREGVVAYGAGRHVEAADFFRRASRYADKPSQAMYAEMLWRGEGVVQNRPLAYAWMDLAAERAYPGFLIRRERYWAALTEAERALTLQVGQAVYPEYGDDVSKPRLARELRRALREMTGSRTGFRGTLEVMVPGPGGEWLTIPGDKYYADRYWKPAQYWAWQDGIWRAPRKPMVEVGPLRKVDTPLTPTPKR